MRRLGKGFANPDEPKPLDMHWHPLVARLMVSLATHLGSKGWTILALGLGLAACATPRDLPLPTRPGLIDNLAALNHGKQSLPPRLTVSQVALLALRNNPDLMAIRAQHGVAQAQVLQAGLLPNPQVSSAFLPLVAGVGTTSAWNAGISEDIRSLITLSSTRSEPRGSAPSRSTRRFFGRNGR